MPGQVLIGFGWIKSWHIGFGFVKLVVNASPRSTGGVIHIAVRVDTKHCADPESPPSSCDNGEENWNKHN